jgi:GTP-binding protein
MSSNFIDYVKIMCRSGAGGPGSIHFRREKFAPKGGPDGGDGGRGGHVVLRGNAQLWTLLHLKYTKHVFAKPGAGGEGARCTGKQGDDAIIEVPIGTVVKDAETGQQLAEIMQDGQEVILFAGGRGGLGNSNFATPTQQTPRYAQPGEPGIEQWVVIELKVLADVGLVGLPNAGKSTLLSVVSAARPEIADYPFTTLVPNLGVVRYKDDKSFVMADIPGIIEGAAEGKGLGTRFLRHIERNSILLFMVPVDSPNIKQEYEVLLNEVRQYNPELLDKKRLLALTKADMIDDEMERQMEAELPEGVPHLFISSVAQKNIEALKDLIWAALRPSDEEATSPDQPLPASPEDEEWP